MTKAEEKLRQAHDAALRVVEVLTEMRKLTTVLNRGMSPGSPDLVDVDVRRAELQAAYDAARDVLDPDPFADLYDEPFPLEGHTVTSGHDGALELAAWLLGMKWSCAAFDDFYAKYYRGEEEGVDWAAMRDCDDPPTVWMYDMSVYRYGAHRKLLKTEYARAVKEARVHTWVPDISYDEKLVLIALHNGPLGWKALAKEVKGDMAESKFRTLLSRMEGRGLLDHNRARGYWRGTLADAALEKADFDRV